MHTRSLLPFAALTLLPRLAAAQVYVVPPHEYIRQRIHQHLRHAGRVWVPAPPAVVVAPPRYVAPAPRPPMYAVPVPPPPVYVAPAPPPPIYYAPPPPAAPVVVVARPRSPPSDGWRSKVGLGVRGSGVIAHDGWGQLGIGGELLLRLSPHLVTELATEYQRSAGDTPGGTDRMDVPVTFGLRLHIGRPN